MKARALVGWLAATVVAAVAAACGADDLPAGVTRPPDGADGVCCPASYGGGCGKAGGYEASADKCESLCDGLCNPRIVTGVHGCPTLAYDNPGADQDNHCQRIERDAGEDDADASPFDTADATVDGAADADAQPSAPGADAQPD